MRLDKAIAQKFSIPRTYAGNLIVNGNVLFNGRTVVHKDLHTTDNDVLELVEKADEIRILFENELFAIVYKPYNLSVCRSFNTPKVEKVLNEELGKKMPLSTAKKAHEFGLPHRLDKLTEGLMLITKTDEIYEQFLFFFEQKLIHKKYVGVVDLSENIHLPTMENFSSFICKHGCVNFSLDNDEKCLCEKDDTWAEWRINYEEKKDKVVPGSQGEMLSFARRHGHYMEIAPITGIRHQVRFSMQQMQLPVCGDPIYGSKKFHRMLLFSTFLGFPAI